jgi:hypothetical protein
LLSLAFTLINLDQNGWLIIRGGGEDLGFASGDNSVTRDQLSEDTAGSLNTKGKSGNIDKDNILSAFFPREDTTLDGGTIGNIRIASNVSDVVHAAMIEFFVQKDAVFQRR